MIRLYTMAGLVLFVVVCFGCGVTPDPRTTIVGIWQGDPDNAKSDPDIKKESENNPMGEFFVKAMEEFYKSLRVEITADHLSITMQMPGEERKNESVAYKVIASGKETVTIEGIGEGAGSEKLMIRIVDRDHIRIVSERPSDEQPAFILKRAN